MITDDVFSHSQMSKEDAELFLLTDALCPYLNNASIGRILQILNIPPVGTSRRWDYDAIQLARSTFVHRDSFSDTYKLHDAVRHELCLLAVRNVKVVGAILALLPKLKENATITSQWFFLKLYIPSLPKGIQEPTVPESVVTAVIDTYVSKIVFDEAWLGKFPQDLVVLLCDRCILSFFNETHIWPSTKVVDTFLESRPFLQGTDALFYGSMRFLMGKDWRCEGTKDCTTDDESVHLLQGVVEVLQGNYTDAYDHLNEPATEWCKSRNVKNLSFYPDFYGVLFFLARLQEKKNLDKFIPDCETIFSLIQNLKEKLGYTCLTYLYKVKYHPDYTLPRETYRAGEFISVFSRILNFLVCLAQKQDRSWMSACVALRDQYAAYSPYIFNILNDIVREGGGPDASPIEGFPYQPWTDLAKGLAQWELQMDSLTKLLGADDSAKKGEKQRRLIWLLDFENETVIPYVQVRTSSGKWSQGQKMAVKRLFESDEPWITPQDRDMVAAYEVEYYSYGSREYGLNPLKAFQTLVDHPLLFSLRDRSPIKLELRSVQLNVTEQEKDSKCLIKLSAHPNNSSGYYVEEVGDGVWALYIFDSMLQSLHDILGPSGMELPTNELPTFLNVAQKLKKVHVNLQTPVPRKPGDPMPVVQLWQQGSTYLAQLRVRPAGGTEGTTYIPADGKAEVIQVQSGQTVVLERDFSAESQKVRDLLLLCPSLTDLDVNFDWASEDLMDFFRVISELKDANETEEHCHLEWPKGEKFKLVGKVEKSQLSIRTRRSGEWFALSGEARINEMQVLELSELLERSNGKNPFVQLKNGEFVSLSDDVKRSLERLRLLTSKKNAKERVVHPLAGALVEELCADVQHESDYDWNDMIRRMRTAFQLKPEVPAGLQAELRPYQTAGFVWLCRLSEWGVGGCLADDMGLGKTIQSIAVMLREAQQGPCLIIAPTSVCPNWAEELNRFAPSLQVVRLRDASDRKAMVDEMQAGMVMVAGYGLLPREDELLATKKWQMVVFDEAQALKNSTTQRSRAAHKIQAHFTLALTGTPIENHLEDLWSVFDIINPGLLGTLPDFHRRFGSAQEGGPSAAALKMLIRPFILRRLKSQVLDDLPDLTEQTIVIEPTEKEAAFYESIRRNAVKHVSENDLTRGQRRFCILTELTRLRRACCHATLADPQAGAYVEPISSKLTRFLELMEEARSGGHKMLVFSQFVGHLSLVRQELEKREVPFQYLDGSTTEEQRRERVAAFQRGEGDVFLISLKAGGQGLNLTAADIVVHLDPWWNPAVEDQATDRAHRIGQKNTVTVYRLVMAHSVEEKILKLHARKRDLAADFLEGSEEAVTSATLSEEELLSLLQ